MARPALLAEPGLQMRTTTAQVEITVAALIEDRGRFLVVEELAGGRAVINHPAGHLEPGETLTQAVIRETREETGYRFEPTAVLGLYDWPSGADDVTVLRVAFRGQAEPPREAPVLDEVIIATHWFSREQLLARESALRSPMVLRCIDDYRAGMRFPLSCLAELSLEDRLGPLGG
jgi:8-oxo-dGTP pyrophosphatase MutT (NUDIX family)